MTRAGLLGRQGGGQFRGEGRQGEREADTEGDGDADPHDDAGDEPGADEDRERERKGGGPGLEASALDARQELEVAAHDDPADDLAAYLEALIAFLTTSDAGAAYRALVGEAQHDSAVGELLRGRDPIGESAAVVLARALPGERLSIPTPRATALLVGPVFFWVLNGRDPHALDPRGLAVEFLRGAAASTTPT